MTPAIPLRLRLDSHRSAPQRAAAAASDSPTHWLVFTDLKFLFYEATEATTNHNCNNLKLTATGVDIQVEIQIIG